jgi:hypothetical protein
LRPSGIMGDSELSPPLSLGCIPRPLWGYSTRCQWIAWSGGDIHPPSKSGRGPRIHKVTHWGAGTNLGAPLFVLVRTQVWIQACFRRQNRSLITYQRLLVTASWSGTMSLWFKDRVEVLCSVRVYKSASLRCSPAVKWVRSPDPWFHGELIRSRVSPN